MNEAVAAGAKERDPLADVERQGPISWALHSIRTRYSLVTAFCLPLPSQSTTALVMTS